MGKIKTYGFFRIISVILVIAFFNLDLAWAYPPQPQANCTLATQGLFQVKMLTEGAQNLCDLRVSEIQSMVSAFHVAKYLFGDPEEGIKPLPFNFLASVMETELGETFARNVFAEINFSGIAPLSSIEEALQSGSGEVEIPEYMPADGVIVIPYKHERSDDIECHIQITLKEHVSPADLAGYQWIISDKYVVKILSKGYTEPVPAEAETTSLPQVTISEPIAEVSSKESETLQDIAAPKKPFKFDIRNIITSIILVILTPLTALADTGSGTFSNFGLSDALFWGALGGAAIGVLFAVRRVFSPLNRNLRKLKSSNLDVSADAAKALGRLGDQRAVEPLIEKLGIEKLGMDATIYRQSNKTIVEALVCLDPQRAVAALVERLKMAESDTAVAFSAQELVRLDPQRAVEPLVEKLGMETTSYTASKTIVKELVRLDPQRTFEALVEKLGSVGKNDTSIGVIAEILGKLGDKRAVEPLIKKLETVTDEYSVEPIAEILVRLDPQRAVEPLIEKLGMLINERLMIKIVGILVRLDRQRAVEALVERLKITTDGLRFRTITRVLGRFGGQRAVEALVEMLKTTTDDAPFYFDAIIGELGRLGGQGAVEALDERFRMTKDKTAAAFIAQELIRLDRQRAVEALVERLGMGTDEGVLSYIAEKIAEKSVYRDDEKVIEALIEKLKMSTGRLALIYITKALGNLKDKRAVEPLIEKLGMVTNTKDIKIIVQELIRLGGQIPVETLIEKFQLVTVTNEELLEIIAEELVRLDPQRAVEPLIEKLRSVGKYVRKYDGGIGIIVEILGKLGDKIAVEPLVERFKIATNKELLKTIALALGRLGDKRAIEPLIEKLWHLDGEVRVSVTGILEDLIALPEVAREIPKLEELKAYLIFANMLVQEELEDSYYSDKQFKRAEILKIFFQLIQTKNDAMALKSIISKNRSKITYSQRYEVYSKYGEEDFLGYGYRDADTYDYSALAELSKDPDRLRELMDAEIAKQSAEEESHDFKAVSGFRASLLTGSLFILSLLGGAAQYYREGDFTGVTLAALLAGAYFGCAAVRYFFIGRATYKALVDAGFSPKEARTTAIAKSDGYRHPAFEELPFEIRNTIIIHESFKSHFWGMVSMLPIVSWMWKKLEEDFNPRIKEVRRLNQEAGRLNHKYDWVRRDAAEALGEIGGKKEVPLLIRALEDKDEKVREAAANSLAKIGEIGGKREGLALIKTALEDKDKKVREAAANSLAKIGGKKMIQLLVETSNDRNWKVIRNAKAALRIIREKYKPHNFTAQDGYMAARKAYVLSITVLASAISLYVAQLGDIVAPYVFIGSIIVALYSGWAATRYFMLGRATYKALVDAGISPKEARAIAIARSDGYRHLVAFNRLSPGIQKLITIYEGFKSPFWGMMGMLPMIAAVIGKSNKYSSSVVKAEEFAERQAEQLRIAEEPEVPDTLEVHDVSKIAVTPEASKVDVSDKNAQLFELAESIINNRRTRLVIAGNEIINFLSSRDVLPSEVGSLDLSEIDREQPTVEIRKRLETVMTAIDILQEAAGRESTAKTDIPGNVTAAVAEIRKDIDTLENDSIRASALILARKARRQGQYLIIGLGSNWMPGYQEKSAQKGLMYPLVRDIESLPKTLKRDFGLDNVIVVHTSEDKLAGELLKEADRTHTTDLSNIMVLASDSSISLPEDSKDTDYFAPLRSTPAERKAFLVGINPQELEKHYKKYGASDRDDMLKIKIMEMLSIAMELAAGKNLPNLPIIDKEKSNMALRMVILLPDAESVNYDTLQNFYEKQALKSV